MSGGELTLVALSTPGVLDINAAASYERLKVAAATTGTTNKLHAYRSYEDQLHIFTAYYTTSYAASDKNSAHAQYWNGQTWWRKPGFPAAAKPGTSNHGKGDTVDWQGIGGYGTPAHNAFMAIATQHGWNNLEGQTIDEPWHLTYVYAHDTHRSDPQPPPPVPTPPTTEDDEMSFTATDAAGAVGPAGQTWHISGLFRRPISIATRDALSVLAAPATVPWLHDIGADALAGYADISGGQFPVVTVAP